MLAVIFTVGSWTPYWRYCSTLKEAVTHLPMVFANPNGGFINDLFRPLLPRQFSVGNLPANGSPSDRRSVVTR
jgi:hypothetical protein